MKRLLAPRIEAANTALIVNGDVDAIPEFFSAVFVAHLTDRDLPGGHDAVRRILDQYLRAFAPLQVEVAILVESTDRIAWQRTLRGIHKGAFLGFPATGRPIVWRDMVTSRFEDGRIVEDWSISDLAERLLLARKG